MTLTSHPSGSDPLRPFQVGGVSGQDVNGTGTQTRRVRWLVDTGAMVTVVLKKVGDEFVATPTGVTAGPTTGSTGIVMYEGLTAHYEVECSVCGVQHMADYANQIGVKSDNVGSNILGMDAIAASACDVLWDPSGGIGSIHL